MKITLEMMRYSNPCLNENDIQNVATNNDIVFGETDINDAIDIFSRVGNVEIVAFLKVAKKRWALEMTKGGDIVGYLVFDPLTGTHSKFDNEQAAAEYWNATLIKHIEHIKATHSVLVEKSIEGEIFTEPFNATNW
jgi:hypothetical protein